MNKHEKNLVLCGIGGCLDKLAFLPQVTSLVSKGEVKEGEVGQMIDFELGDTPENSNMVVYFGLGEKDRSITSCPLMKLL